MSFRSGCVWCVPRPFLFVAFLALVPAASIGAQELSVRLGLFGGERLTRHPETVRLRFHLTNEGRRAVHVLRWDLPFEGFRGRLFEVTCAGQPIAYRGPVVKRGEPSPAEYFELGAGETLSAIVDLAPVYDLPQGGTCQVSWDRLIHDVIVGEAPPGGEPQARQRAPFRPQRLSASPVTFQLAAPPPPGAAADNGCDASQQADLATALPAGTGLARDAQTYLESVAVPDRPSDARYRTWFGAYDAGRYGTVANRYDEIVTAAEGSLTFDCTGTGSCGGVTVSCDPGDYAFTCAGGAGATIWLCGGFWNAPPTGEDSQAGTIVHELSHWFGTDDHSYGCPSCQQLADDDPPEAVTNADNCEYFAENFGLVCP